MINDSIRIEDRAILDALNRLQKGTISDVVLKALRKGGEILQKETQEALKLKLGKGATSTIHHNKPMLKGIVVSEDKSFLNVRVSLYGDFRLKWFEMGTKERILKRTGAKDRARGRTKGDRRYLYRKKGKENFYREGTRRGKIKALDFFEEARDKELAHVVDVVTKELTRELQNITR